MSSIYEFKERVFTQNDNVSKLTVNSVSVELFKKATIHYMLQNSNNVIVKSGIFAIDNSEYRLWADDDNYIYQIVLQKLGITLDPIDPVDPIPVSDP